MQGQRGTVGSLPETFFDHGSTSSNGAIEQQICWNNIRNPIENRLPDCLLSPNDMSIGYVNSIAREEQELGRWNIGEPSSSGTKNEVSHNEQKMNPEWSSSLSASANSANAGPRLEERRYSAGGNVNISAPSGQMHHRLGLDQSSRLLPTDHSLDMRSTPVVDNASPQNPNVVLHVPTFPRNVQPFRWNGGYGSSTGSSSSNVSGDRDAVPREGHQSRSIARNVLDHPMYVPAPELRTLVRNPTSRGLSSGNISVPGNGGSTSRAGSSSGANASSASTWVPRPNPSTQCYTEDIFNSSLNLEEAHYQEGYSEGYNHGITIGKEEASQVGLKTGFETGKKLGFYKGCVDVWNSSIQIDPIRFSPRVQKGIKQMQELIQKYPVMDPENESVQEIMEALKLKFRVIRAAMDIVSKFLLNLKANYLRRVSRASAHWDDEEQMLPRVRVYCYPPGRNMPEVPMSSVGGGMLSVPYDMGGMSLRDAGIGQPMPIPALATALANAMPEQQRTMLGESVYPLVERLERDSAAKVTGMLLEMDQTEVLHLLESPEALKAKVAEALEVLRTVAAQQQANSPADQLASLSLNDNLVS
ncbi:hypothetical protein REPUB_Repub19eG0047100 [Reevesia pubescens]